MSARFGLLDASSLLNLPLTASDISLHSPSSENHNEPPSNIRPAPRFFSHRHTASVLRPSSRKANDHSASRICRSAAESFSPRTHSKNTHAHGPTQTHTQLLMEDDDNNTNSHPQAARAFTVDSAWSVGPADRTDSLQSNLEGLLKVTAARTPSDGAARAGDLDTSVEHEPSETSRQRTGGTPASSPARAAPSSPGTGGEGPAAGPSGPHRSWQPPNASHSSNSSNFHHHHHHQHHHQHQHNNFQGGRWNGPRGNFPPPFSQTGPQFPLPMAQPTQAQLVAAALLLAGGIPGAGVAPGLLGGAGSLAATNAVTQLLSQAAAAAVASGAGAGLGGGGLLAKPAGPPLLHHHHHHHHHRQPPPAAVPPRPPLGVAAAGAGTPAATGGFAEEFKELVDGTTFKGCLPLEFLPASKRLQLDASQLDRTEQYVHLVLFGIPHSYGPSEVAKVLEFFDVRTFYVRIHEKQHESGRMMLSGSAKVFVHPEDAERATHLSDAVWCREDCVYIVASTQAADAFLRTNTHRFGTHVPYKLMKVEYEDKSRCEMTRQTRGVAPSSVAGAPIRGGFGGGMFHGAGPVAGGGMGFRPHSHHHHHHHHHSHHQQQQNLVAMMNMAALVQGMGAMGM